MKNIPSHFLQDQEHNGLDIFDSIFNTLISTQKVPRYAYSILRDKHIPDKRTTFWENLADDSEEVDWDKVHFTNFKCSIDTRLRSFYFKIFHNAIAFNDFLFKINRKDSPNCIFCNNHPETIIHFFCECEVAKSLWKDLINIIKSKEDIDFSVSAFEKVFGIQDDKFLTYLFLCLKYYLYICKFQNKIPNFAHFLNFLKQNRETEYFIAKRHDKLTIHFKKWRFEL